MFFIDGDETNGVYEGFTRGDNWNGWACPYFSKETGLRIARALKGVFDKDKDQFVFTDENYDPPEDKEYFEGFDIKTTEGKRHVYAIGAFGWIWNEKNFLDPDSEITTEKDFRDFENWLMRVRHVNFHPDNGFEEYIDVTNHDKRTFTKAEAEILNRQRTQAFDLLGDKIYDIGLEELRRYEAELEGPKP
jgi:hypothetical protein